MPALELTPAQRAALRAQAHALKPVVLIGEQGLSPANLKEIDVALRAHGLIKVRVFGDDAAARQQILATVCDQLGAAPVQIIGKLLVVWRPLPPDETAAPAKPNRGRAPRQVKLVIPSKSPNHRPKVKRVTVLGNQRLTAGGKIKKAKPRAVSLKKTGG